MLKKKEEKKKAQREKRRRKYREAKIKEKTNCTKPYCSELYSSGDSFSVVDSKHEKKKYERLNTVTIHSCTIPLSVRSNDSKTKGTISSNENSTKSKGTAIRAIYIELKKLTKEEEAQRK